MRNIDERRITYKENVLDQVICQLRFRPILTIETTIPAEFQEKLRKKFPIYREKTDVKVHVEPKAFEMIPSEVLDVLGKYPTNKNHEFLTEDGVSQINLTRFFIAYSTKKYTNWEEFETSLFEILKYFTEIYSINEFTRIGLRYINIIQRSRFNLEQYDWNKLINKKLLGLMDTTDIGKSVQSFESKCDFELDDNESTLRVISQLIERVDTGEKCLKIDNDIFSTKKYLYEELEKKLKYFNERGTNFFTWCITERLHKAMKPEYHE